jgi:hypothetical protein
MQSLAQTSTLSHISELVYAFAPFHLRMETDTASETLCSFHNKRHLASYNGSNTKNQLCFCGIETHDKVGEQRRTKEINQSIPHVVHGG